MKPDILGRILAGIAMMMWIPALYTSVAFLPLWAILAVVCWDFGYTMGYYETYKFWWLHYRASWRLRLMKYFKKIFRKDA